MTAIHTIERLSTAREPKKHRIFITQLFKWKKIFHKNLNVFRAYFFHLSFATHWEELIWQLRRTFGCTSAKFIFAPWRLSSSFFPKLFAGAVHLCQRTVVTRVPMRLSRSSSLKHWRLIVFVGLLKSNYPPRPYLRTVPVGPGGTPGSVFSGEEPSIAKENNYPSAVRVSCGTRTIKINIGSLRHYLWFTFICVTKRRVIFLPLRRWPSENYRSFPSNQFVFTLSAYSKYKWRIRMIASGIK